MAWRFAGRAEEQIDEVVLASARKWGIEAAARYNRLIFAAIAALGEAPALPGSRPLPEFDSVRSLHLRSARHLVAREHRVGEPRHLIVYRVALDGTVEVLGLVHDRQQLSRAARRAHRDAGG
jgi:toxin ParE1/3/4